MIDIKEFFYIYNVKQADFFVKNNLQPIEIGKGNSQAVYIKFLRNDDSNKVFDMWCNIQNK
jgi:hypothetical protein